MVQFRNFLYQLYLRFTILIYEQFLGMMLTIWVTPFVNIMISTVYKQVATVKYSIIATALEKFYF